MKTHTIPKPIATKNGHETEDIEALAAKARQARLEKCHAEIQALLDKHNSQMDVAVMLGQQEVPIRAILNLPVTIRINSK